MKQYRKVFLPEFLQYFRLCGLEGKKPKRKFYFAINSFLKIIGCDIISQTIETELGTVTFEDVKRMNCLFEEI